MSEVQDISEPEATQSAVRGGTQAGLRAHNERLVLSMVRQNGPLAKVQIAKMTGLSAQTVSVIMRSLESDGLLVKGEPVRGKVGQPSTPIGLSATGAYFFGFKIGRRSAELALTDFLGRIVARRIVTYRYPELETTLAFAQEALEAISGSLCPEGRLRIAGIGVAMPYQIWDWERTIGLPPGTMSSWRDVDIRAELGRFSDLPVHLSNDASAACGAELVFGAKDRPSNFLYFYIGYFIGGGIVLRDNLYTGLSGNAGALGSMPVPGPDGRMAQLIDVASLSQVESAMQAQGLATAKLWSGVEGWDVPKPILAEWTERAAQGMAYAIASAAALIDLDAVLIDGWISPDLRLALVDRTTAALDHIDVSGISPPVIRPGTVGHDARVLGAASLPLSERFLVEAGAGFNTKT
ncbi:Sugar kinase of the NBD/HSP70 family, may contain an N-terminal HTH domain [Poseidonocella pacifica]|uniref:Sugar kinase of the NBD/HSP70 family, may contain an N-terminal HTH domain n=1 Tax=Poseidonocella pacifica TaxID=871651 RepID=A0A1I0VG50_9RHOB|nr:ROK family transcriptional regulator [Poseidonocella pacifica]SFA75449.1 Sugar kinase of the NBD/HSP70 family, may contain an N-terminal HTH domain [Poseidonocella pacifica]